MSELRYNPLLRTWTMVGSNRQARPHLPKDWCPFCPGSGKVPSEYVVHQYDNDFPIMSPTPPVPDDVATGLYETAPAAGKCEVILYSPEHRAVLHELSVPHIRQLVDLWCSRCTTLAADERVKYIFPFENRGEEVGVTMPHPHGQIYAYPFVPLKLELELGAARDHHAKTGRCLICDINAEEAAFRRRVVFEDEHFRVYVPFFTDYPYGAFIAAKRHIDALTGLDDAERTSLAHALKWLVGAFDTLFDRPFPYMMCVHQSPVNSPEWTGAERFFHLHIEFYPPLRQKDKIKFYAGSEMGAFAAGNVAAVEETTMHLRRARLRFLSRTERNAIASELKAELGKELGPGVPGRVFAAPARVNLIGEHIDYNGGKVFPAALEMQIYMALRPRTDGKICLRNLDFAEPYDGDIAAPIEKSETCTWANYPLGVLFALKERGHVPSAGFDALFYSEVPTGAGVSSSAALEVVFGYGLSEAFGFGLSRPELALIGQRAENAFVGVSCGIMDQFAVAVSRSGHALLLDCATLEHRHVPLALGDYRIVIANTNKPRTLAGSKYNERRAECDAGRDALKEALPELVNLASLSLPVFEAHAHLIGDEVIQRRVRHVITECARVEAAALALERGDLKTLGTLMIASHESLRDDYEVTGRELDALFAAARKAKGCMGTRMTGAGFGGCTVSLVREDALAEFQRNVALEYTAATGLLPEFFVCSAGDGVREI